MLNKEVSIYYIKDRNTGFYIPRPYNYRQRGGSFTEPCMDVSKARSFFSELSAKQFLAQWVKGEHHSQNDWDDEEAAYYVKIVPKPSRNKQNMEIVKITFTLP